VSIALLRSAHEKAALKTVKLNPDGDKKGPKRNKNEII